MKLSGFFKSFDQFSHQLSVKANNKDSHSTCLTLFFTIIIIIFFLAYFPVRLYKYIVNRPYNLNVVYAKSNQLDITSVEPNNMHMVVIANEIMSSVNSSGKPITIEKSIERIADKKNTLEIESYFPGEDNEFISNSEELDSVQKCDSSPELLDLYDSLYDQSEILRERANQNYCTNPKKAGKVGGLYFLGKEQHYTVLTNTLQMTYSEKDGKKSCPYLLNNSYYAFIYKNYVADYEDQDDPVKQSIYNYVLPFEGHTDILVFIRLRKTVITTDSNYVGDFLEHTTHEFFSVDRIVEKKANFINSEDVNGKEDCELRMRFYFEIDDNVLEVHREYEKLDNFIANSTGFIGFVALFFQIFLEYIEENAIDEVLIRKLYCRDFQLKIGNKKGKIQEKPSSFGLKESDSINKIIGVRNKEKNHWSPICKLRKIQNLSKKALRYFEYDCDLLTIMRKILLFEALIKVLLTDEQLKLLNLVNVRKISEEMDMDKQIKQLEERFPMPGKMDGVVAQVDDIPGDDYLTSRILEEIEES